MGFVRVCLPRCGKDKEWNEIFCAANREFFSLVKMSAPVQERSNIMRQHVAKHQSAVSQFRFSELFKLSKYHIFFPVLI